MLLIQKQNVYTLNHVLKIYVLNVIKTFDKWFGSVVTMKYVIICNQQWWKVWETGYLQINKNMNHEIWFRQML